MKKEVTSQRREDITGYAFLLPSLIGMLVFSMLPLLVTMYISFTDWNYLKGLGNWNFIGLRNFKELWSDTWFTASLKNTFIYTLGTVPVALVLSLTIAVLIENFCRTYFANGIRVALYMPQICNIVATAAVWKMMFSSYGPFTNLMRALGWTNVPRMLTSYTWALPAVMLVAVWQAIGYRVFIYSAALQGLPSDLYEAASIDGANGWKKFFYITIPQLRPTTFFLTITSIIGSFKVFGLVNIMTEGGPGDSTYTLVYYIYKAAFSFYRMGYASAIAMVLFVIMLVFTIIRWFSNKRTEG